MCTKEEVKRQWRPEGLDRGGMNVNWGFDRAEEVEEEVIMRKSKRNEQSKEKEETMMTEVKIISNKNDEWLKRKKNEVIMMKCIKEVGIMDSEED